jgi:hypothetical protein
MREGLEVLQAVLSFVQTQSEPVRNYILAGVAITGLWIAWRRVIAANRQAEAALQQAAVALDQQKLSRRDHVAELFNKAVEQLVSEKLEIRLGAIFTLRQIQADFPDLAGPTFQLLNAYLRQHSRDYGNELPPVDIYEIMETLKERLGTP